LGNCVPCACWAGATVVGGAVLVLGGALVLDRRAGAGG
jgi:hypothetical protein